jgi:hypothetical protein
MIGAVITATLLRLIREPTRVVVVVLAAFLVGSVMGPKHSSFVGALFAVVLGAGIIGREGTAGTLALAFTRPIKRRDYALAKWAALIIAGMAASLLTVGIGVSRHGAPDVTSLAFCIVDQGLAVIGASAVMIALSASSRGYSDVGMWVTGVTGGALLKLYGGLTGSGWMVRAGTDVQSLLAPSVDFDLVQNAVGVPYFTILCYLSNVVLAFTVAVVILNRRELIYAG